MTLPTIPLTFIYVYRFLRNSVSSFRNQTGYSRRMPHRPAAVPVQQLPPVPGDIFLSITNEAPKVYLNQIAIIFLNPNLNTFTKII